MVLITEISSKEWDLLDKFFFNTERVVKETVMENIQWFFVIMQKLFVFICMPLKNQNTLFKNQKAQLVSFVDSDYTQVFPEYISVCIQVAKLS